MLLIILFSNGVCYAGGDEIQNQRKSKFISSKTVSEKSLLSQLNVIEKKLSHKPEENISKLELIIKQAIQGNHQTAKTKAYWLMARTYKDLQQGDLALKFMNLALGKENIDLETKNSKKTRYKGDQVTIKNSGSNSPAIPDTIKTSENTKVASEESTINEFSQEQNSTPEAASTKNSTSLWSSGTLSGTSSSSFSTSSTLPNSHNEDMAEIQILLGNYELSNDYYTIYKSSLSPGEQRTVDYKIAQNLYAAKQYKKAVVAYELLLTSETDNEKKALCNARIAGCQISLGNTEEGLTYYQNSVSQSNYSRATVEATEEDYKEFSSNKEVVTKALRDQNKFEEEVNLRAEIVEITKDKMEYLKLAQSYHQVGKLKEAENALDKYFEDISYDIIDEREIEVIKAMSIAINESGNATKAYNYLFQYEDISDSIKVRVDKIRGFNSRIGASGVQNVLDLKILQKDKEISDNMITHLVDEQELQEKALGFQKTIIYLLSFLILVSLGTTLYIVKVSKQRRVANQQLAIRSLRSQMNPHFIFNALNSINSFISMNDERSANKFLTEFSTLMRSVMENSEHDFIPLSKEVEIIDLYLGLEHYRFKDKFSYKLNVEDELDEDEILLPPMLIQPFIENSIWHGLRYKETAGMLTVSFEKNKNNLEVTIQDDGIGRTKSQELKTKNQKKNKSTAIKNIDQRIKLISALHNIKVSVNIQDLEKDGSGTKIILSIPQIKA